MTDATSDALASNSPTPDSPTWWHRPIVPVLVVYWMAMLWGTHRPPGPPGPDLHLDKVAHLGGFFGLAVLVGLTLHKYGRAIWIALPIVMLYAAADELTQPSFGRTADPLDWIADGIGAVCGLLALRWALRTGRV